MGDDLTVLSLLHFSPRRLGSIEEYFCALGRRLHAAGGRCVIGVVAEPADDVADVFRANHVAWRIVPFDRGTLASAAAVRRILREVRPTVTHFHFVGLGSPLFQAARWAGAKPILVSHHYSFPLEAHVPRLAWLGRRRRALALAPCRRLVAPSHYMKTCMVERLGLPADGIRVIHNGVNLERFRPGRPATLDVRGEYGIPPDAPIVSTLAHFIPEKGGGDLVGSMPAVLERVPDSHLLMIGDGVEVPRLKELAADLGVADHVHFTGLASGDRMDSLIAESLVTTLVCTWGEAFSLVVLEFMACGKPMVATAVGGTPEAVADGETGFLVPPFAPGKIAEALLKLLEDRDLAERMGRAARRRAEELFDVERMVSDTLDLYGDVLTSR